MIKQRNCFRKKTALNMEPSRTFLWVFLNVASTISQNGGHCALSMAYKYLALRLLINPAIAVKQVFLGSLCFVVVLFFHPETLRFRKDWLSLSCYLGELLFCISVLGPGLGFRGNNSLIFFYNWSYEAANWGSAWQISPGRAWRAILPLESPPSKSTVPPTWHFWLLY